MQGLMWFYLLQPIKAKLVNFWHDPTLTLPFRFWCISLDSHQLPNLLWLLQQRELRAIHELRFHLLEEEGSKLRMFFDTGEKMVTKGRGQMWFWCIYLDWHQLSSLLWLLQRELRGPPFVCFFKGGICDTLSWQSWLHLWRSPRS